MSALFVRDGSVVPVARGPLDSQVSMLMLCINRGSQAFTRQYTRPHTMFGEARERSRICHRFMTRREVCLMNPKHPSAASTRGREWYMYLLLSCLPFSSPFQTSKLSGSAVSQISIQALKPSHSNLQSHDHSSINMRNPHRHAQAIFDESTPPKKYKDTNVGLRCSIIRKYFQSDFRTAF